MITSDLPSLNWLSSLGVANRSPSQVAAQQLSCTPGQVHATIMSNSTSAAGLHGTNWSQLPSATDGSSTTSKLPRPACSYSCLIAMSLKACSAGSLPVSEIYRFIEREYPYYRTAPDGWKNSIRHNLSLNASFCKAERPDGLQMKKGCYWMISPDRLHVVEGEIQRFLAQEGRSLIESGEAPQTSHHQNYSAQPMQCNPTKSTGKQSAPRTNRPPLHRPPPPSSSYANCQKMNDIFGINWDPYIAGNACLPKPYPPQYYNQYGGIPPYGSPMGYMQQELFDFSPSLVGPMSNNSFTHFNTYPLPASFPGPDGWHIFNSQPEDTLPNAYSDEYWLSESPPSPTSSCCSLSSSATSLKAVDKILTNIAGSHPPVPLINDVEQLKVKKVPSADLDALLSKMVEERLNDPTTDLVLEHPTSDLEEAAISPVVSSNHLLSPYLCDADNSFMDDGDDQGCSFMEEEEDDGQDDHAVRGKYVSRQGDGGALMRELYTMDQENLIDDGIVTSLTNDVEQLLDNIFQDNFHESADYGDDEMMDQ